MPGAGAVVGPVGGPYLQARQVQRARVERLVGHREGKDPEVALFAEAGRVHDHPVARLGRGAGIDLGPGKVLLTAVALAHRVALAGGGEMHPAAERREAAGGGIRGVGDAVRCDGVECPAIRRAQDQPAARRAARRPGRDVERGRLGRRAVEHLHGAVADVARHLCAVDAGDHGGAEHVLPGPVGRVIGPDLAAPVHMGIKLVAGVGAVHRPDLERGVGIGGLMLEHAQVRPGAAHVDPALEPGHGMGKAVVPVAQARAPDAGEIGPREAADGAGAGGGGTGRRLPPGRGQARGHPLRRRVGTGTTTLLSR